MTVKELFEHMARGGRKVRCTVPVKDSDTGVGMIQTVVCFGREHVRVIVLFEGKKFENVYR